MCMIRSFADKETERLFNDEDVPRFRSIQNPARRRLMLIHRAATLHDLAGPGLSLERMVKERRRRGQHAMGTPSTWRSRIITK
jgi:proteic killer suppression protein